MGSRHYIYTYCAYCKEAVEDVPYAPTCERHTFTCASCDMINFITHNLEPSKMEKVTAADVVYGFLRASTYPEQHSEQTLRKLAKKDVLKWKKANAATKKKNTKG